MSDKELYEFAKKKVESKRGFIIHSGIYFIFSSTYTMLASINGFEPQYVVPVLGWGIGVAFHAISIRFDFSMNLEKSIQKEIRKLRG